MHASPGPASRGEAGFTLVEVLVATVVLTIGLVGLAQLLAVSTLMHVDARQKTNGTLLLQGKVEELAKLNFGTDPQIQLGGSLTANVTNFNDAPAAGVTRRWVVQAGPGADPRLRRLTVRVINGAARYQQLDLTTVIRQW